MRILFIHCVVFAALLCLPGGCSPGDGSSETASVTEISVDASQPAGGAGEVQVAKSDWPWWRGPTGNGIAGDDQAAPVQWSDSKNVAWKSPLPGRGHSSPTVVGNRIYLATADEKQQIQSVLCLDRTTGKLIWDQIVHRGGFPENIHRKNTHATCTVADDGERLLVAFYNHQAIHVTALDHEGQQLWQTEAGPYVPQQYKFGYAPSPVIYKSLVIIAADFEGGGYLAGLNRQDGTIVWRKPRPASPSYSSPVVANVAGRDQLLISGCEMVASLDPATGETLWSADATTTATCGSMVWDGDLVFASGGYPGTETVCIRADGSGDIVWKNNQKCYEQSMLAHDGYLYAITDGGIAYCWKGDDGSEMWKSRLKGPISASPVLAGGNIYVFNERGKTYVFKADPQQFQLVAENQLGNETFATPTICGGRIYLRVSDGSPGSRQETLYCIGKEEKSEPATGE